MFKLTHLLLSSILVSILLANLAAGQQAAADNQQQAMTVNLQPLQNCTVTTTKPSPATIKYAVKPCIVAQFAAYLNIGNGKYIQFQNATVNQTASQCENATAQQIPKLVIDYECGSLSITIQHTNDSKVFVSSITGLYTLDGVAVTFGNTSQLFTTTQSGHYYKCNSEQDIVVKTNQTLVFNNFALEAYRNASGTDFYQIPEECPLDLQPVSDLVRIGVGICLVALVAIVLIAYFIGRRRWSERSSYESV